MRRIHIYEWEPGDYRFNDAEDFESYVEIDDAIYYYLERLNRMRGELNEALAGLKKNEIDPWDEEVPTK